MIWIRKLKVEEQLTQIPDEYATEEEDGWKKKPTRDKPSEKQRDDQLHQ